MNTQSRKATFKGCNCRGIFPLTLAPAPAPPKCGTAPFGGNDFVPTSLHKPERAEKTKFATF